jgi:hypothetical protein
MPLIRNKLEPGDVDSFLEEENFPCPPQSHAAAAAFAGFGHRPIPTFLESKAKRPRKPVKCLCNMLDKDETDPELLAQSERCRELAKRFKALGDIRGCVTAYPTLAAKGGNGGIVSEIKRRKSQRWCHYLLPPQRLSANDNDIDAATSLRAELLTFDNRVRNHNRKGRAKTYNTKKGRLKDPPPANGSAAAGNNNNNNNNNNNTDDNNEENQDSTNRGTNDEGQNEEPTAEVDTGSASAQPAQEPDSNSQPNNSQTATETGVAAAAAEARPPAGIKRRLAFVAWHHFHPLLIQLLCRDDDKRLYRCPDTVPAWLVHRFDDVECTYRNRDDWSGPNEAFFVPSYHLERAEQDCRATLYQCRLNATIDSAVAQRWGPFEEQRSGMVVAAAAEPDCENDDANDNDRDHEDVSDDEEHVVEHGRNGHRPHTRQDCEGSGGLYMYNDDDANPRYYDPYAEPSPPRHHYQNQQQLSPSHAAPWNRTSPLHRTGPAQPRTAAVVRAGGSAPASARAGATATATTTTTATAINISSDDGKAVMRGRQRGIVLEGESSWREAAQRLFEERNRLQECVCLLMEQACRDAQLDDDRAGDDVRKLEGVVGALQRHKEERIKRKEEELQKQREAEAAAAKVKANAAKAKAKRDRRRNKRMALETTDDVTETLKEDAAEADPAETSKKRKATTLKREGPQLHKRGDVPVTTAEDAAAVRASVVAEASSKVPGETGATSTGPTTNETSSSPSTGSTARRSSGAG